MTFPLSRLTSLLGPALIRWRGRRLAKSLDAAAKNPEQAQRSLLKQLLARHQNTAFGKDHDFNTIQTAADYQQAVPIQDYEDLRPYVDRMMAGEENVLVRDPVTMFNLTSGTTGKPKYIPVTAVSEALNANIMRQWLYRVLPDHPKCFSQSIVGIVSPAIEGYTAGGIPYGSLSGRIYQQIPGLIRQAYAIPYAAFEIQDYDARYWAIARFALERKVSFICTPNPSTLLRLADVMATHSEALIQAIHDGTLGLTLTTDHFSTNSPAKKLLKQIQSRLRPNPKRAKALRRLLNEKGTLQPKDVWPQLQLVGCWTGGSVGAQAQRLSPAYGTVPLRDLGYLASEARVTLPICDHTQSDHIQSDRFKTDPSAHSSSGVLNLTLNYYEFIPEECVNEEDPPIYLSHELVVGQRYSILLTTPGGLYRYNINDIVEVTGFYHQAPMIVFVRKGKDMSNLTGEKLHVNQLLQAMAKVQQQFDLTIEQYQWVASVEDMRYHLYLECQDSHSDDWIAHTLLPKLDQVLGQLNTEYAQKRASRRLQPICCHRMRPGWADALQRIEISTGCRDVQYKWKVLSSKPVDQNLQQTYQQTTTYQQQLKKSPLAG